MKNKFNKKILIVDNGFVGKNKSSYHISGSTNDFIKDLSKLGIDVNVFQFYKDIELNQGMMESELNVKSIVSNFNDNNFLTKTISYIKLICKLIYRLNKFDFVYIFFPGNLNYLSLIICVVFNMKFGIYVRGEVNYKLPFIRNLFRHANIIITNNPIIQSELSSFNDNVKMIVSYLRLGNEIPKLPQKYKSKRFSAKKMRILFVGRVEKRKGVNELIEACKLLENHNLDFKLTVIGGGNLYKSKKSEILNDPILSKKIEFLGFVKDKNILKSYYSKSDIFVLPTYTEGFPRVIFDAMLNNLPILTTMVGGIPGFMKGNYNCVEIKLFSAQDIYEKIIYIYENQKFIDKIQLNVFEKLHSIYSDDFQLHMNILNSEINK